MRKTLIGASLFFGSNKKMECQIAYTVQEFGSCNIGLKIRCAPIEMNKENYFEPNHRLKSLFQDVEIIPDCPLIRYFRSGPEMISMAKTYEKEGDLERAFMLYYKYITLFLEKLPSLPQYKTIPSIEKHNVKEVLKEVLPKAEELKLKVLNKYSKEYENLIKSQKEVEESIRKKNEEDELLKQIEHEKTKIDKPRDSYTNIPKTANISNSIVHNNFNSNHFCNPYNEFNKDEFNLNNDLTKTEMVAPIVPSRSLKPKDVNGNMNDEVYRDHTSQLRIVKIPKNLAAIFLSLAESNTEKNIETGGHLFGKLSQNVFTITHLVIPKQSGKSDSFSAINEEEMVDFKEAKNLLTLGWIHTHPSQTAFLSSVDLHNQFPNQQLLPEYVAIVCAPSHDQTKIFTITPDYGMNVLATCKESGFHYHPQDPPLYQECEHVVLEAHLDVAVEDLRRKR